MKPEVNIAALAKQTYLRPAQRADLQRSIRNGEDMVKRGQDSLMFGSHQIDLDVVADNLRRDQEALERGTPPPLSTMDKRKLFREEQRLREAISHGMPSYEQMERPTANNVDAHMMWERQNKQDILAWKQVRRLLDPDNENTNFTNVETLRTATPSYVDSRAYWDNYPEFEDEIESQTAEVDDETVQHVALYKAAGWAEKNIQRKLGISRDQYRLALQRLPRPEPEADSSGEASGYVSGVALHERILAALRETEVPIPKAELAVQLGVSQRQLSPPLRLLRERGDIMQGDDGYRAVAAEVAVDD